jgi:hypothetical protein
MYTAINPTTLPSAVVGCARKQIHSRGKRGSAQRARPVCR